MKFPITVEQLTTLGLNVSNAETLLKRIESILNTQQTPAQLWQAISKQILSTDYPFAVHLLLFTSLYPHWHTVPESAPAWIPTTDIIASANMTTFMEALNIRDVKMLQQWAAAHPNEFWQRVVELLHIQFDQPYHAICNLNQGIEAPLWFDGATMNIANSCFNAPENTTAIIYENTNHELKTLSYRELNDLSNRIANSLLKQGLQTGDAIGIAMPMNQYAVAIYLGIIKMGGVVVSIADSFSSEEMDVRLHISRAKAVFTQDFIPWAKKKIPLYEKVKNCSHADSLKIIVLSCDEQLSLPLRDQDKDWSQFLVENTHFTAVPCDPMSACNILFSSGTTGTPKAIIWNHTTGIKAASDAYFHQNIIFGDILAWPTNLGWMMGPWLIYAALINQGSIALYLGSPKERDFGLFIERAKVTMLGVVPTLVATWRQTQCMEKLNWNTIKVFSSTGECSNPEDMLYLMSLAGYKPIIEYCGGTEIGGSYLTSTVLENNYPALFSTPTMGLDISILDEEGRVSDQGEVAIIPPSIGLSTMLLNANHHDVYFKEMPKTAEGKILRRHGDQIKQLLGRHYTILGRVDDTMKLGGIKISATEIERVLTGLPHIIEVAAIAVPPPHNGPHLLVIYVATTEFLDKQLVLKEMQKRINTLLNPLFKIHDVIFTNELPKTASNKIMRRVLRKQYQAMPSYDKIK